MEALGADIDRQDPVVRIFVVKIEGQRLGYIRERTEQEISTRIRSNRGGTNLTESKLNFSAAIEPQRRKDKAATSLSLDA
jgi:predicted component of type VI protein secretion system